MMLATGSSNYNTIFHSFNALFKLIELHHHHGIHCIKLCHICINFKALSKANKTKSLEINTIANKTKLQDIDTMGASRSSKLVKDLPPITDQVMVDYLQILNSL